LTSSGLVIEYSQPISVVREVCGIADYIIDIILTRQNESPQ